MNRLFLIQFVNRECYGFKSVSEICARCNQPEVKEKLEKVLNNAAISNVMPRVGEKFFIEKPARISEGLLNLSLSDHKFHRFMKLLPLEELDNFLQGRFNFRSNSEVYYGSFKKTGKGDLFELSEDVSMYFLADIPLENGIRKPEDTSLIDSEIEAILHDAGLTSVKVSSGEIGEVWEERSTDRPEDPVLILSDIDTLELTDNEMVSLMQGSQYSTMYSKKNSIMIKCGAYFPKASQVPQHVLSIKVDKV